MKKKLTVRFYQFLLLLITFLPIFSILYYLYFDNIFSKYIILYVPGIAMLYFLIRLSIVIVKVTNFPIWTETCSKDQNEYIELVKKQFPKEANKIERNVKTNSYIMFDFLFTSSTFGNKNTWNQND